MEVVTMLNIDIVVVVLLGMIMLLLVLILCFVLVSPGRLSCRSRTKRHTTHIYEAIDDEDDQRHNRVTQVIRIRVSTEDGEFIQQEMLLRVQVEAIPLPSGKEDTASTSTFASHKPELSPKPKLMRLDEAPTMKLKIKDREHSKFGYSQIELEGRKPTPPPKSPSVKMTLTPDMIKDPSLLAHRSHPSEKEHVALIHSRSMEETPGYLQPSSLRIHRKRVLSDEENLTY